MKSKIPIFLTTLATLAAMVYAFYAGKEQWNPLYGLAFKIERKLGKLAGKPDPISQKLKKIESTFLELNGQVLDLPTNDYINGGALTRWGNHLLIIDHRGDIYYLNDTGTIVKSDILSPENGVDAYIELASTEKWNKKTHKPEKIRFNDIEYIEIENRQLLASSYTFFDASRKCYGSRVSTLNLDSSVPVNEFSAKPSDWTTIFESTPCLPLNPTWTAIDGIMAGGRMEFDGKSTLYVGIGDYHLDGIHTYDAGIQDNNTSYGKVIAIDLAKQKFRNFSKGHRNLQGLAITRDGRIWATEHGVRGGDELNLILEGQNYGWPTESLGTLYNGQPIPNTSTYGRHDTYKKPIFAWLPSAGISSLTTIDGIDESWDGDLLAGSLSSEEFGQSLFHIRTDGERIVFAERIKLGVRVRDITQFNEKIAIWTDRKKLVLFDLNRRTNQLEEVEKLLKNEFPQDIAHLALGALNSCAECHSFEQHNNTRTPSLNGVLGRGIASTAFNGYSTALASHRRSNWSESSLRHFLKAPNDFAPGTYMPASGINDDEVMDALIWSLRKIDSREKKHLTYN